MAKSGTFFGFRRGSTKSQTFSVVDGVQITKDRVEGGKDPRTLSQMSQRCIMSTSGNAYAAMKGICNHSFEDKTAGLQCMNEFNSRNMKKLQICKEYDNGFFGFNNRTRLVHACLILCAYYMAGTVELASAVIVSVLLEIQQQQAAAAAAAA